MDNDGNSYMNDGQTSTANGSSVGTPMTGNNGHGGGSSSTKLKLTFNANGGGSNGRGTMTGNTDSGVGSDED